MKNINLIRKELYRLGDIIDAPLNFLSLPSRSKGDGTAHLEIVGKEYHYVFSEKGRERLRKKTSNFDELLYWIFVDITSSMARLYELENRLVNEDHRRLFFSKQIELLGMLSEDWKDIMREEVKIRIQAKPYDDYINERVSLCKKYGAEGYNAEDAYNKACNKFPLPEFLDITCKYRTPTS